MSINHRWRNEHTENGSWIHSIGDESYVLRTFHHRTAWNELPSSLIEDHPSASDKIINDSDSDSSDDSDFNNNDANNNNDQQKDDQQKSKESESKQSDEEDNESSNKTKSDQSAKSIPLNAESHAAFLDFSGDSAAQKTMIQKWRCELNSFNLKDSSFGNIFNKRYAVLASLFEHFEKHGNQPQYDPSYQLTQNQFKKNSKPDFSTVKVPMKMWQQIPGTVSQCIQFLIFCVFACSNTYKRNGCIIMAIGFRQIRFGNCWFERVIIVRRAKAYFE